MSSITTWQRLEPLPRSADLRPGLRAEIADPLWLLARQRQFGELRGEDAGSPVVARIEAESGRLSRLLLGRVTAGDGTAAATPADRSVDHDDRVLPLEVAVEREPVRTTAVGGGLAVEAGLHFLRLLRAHGAAAAVPLYVAAYALTADDLPAPPGGVGPGDAAAPSDTAAGGGVPGDADLLRLRRRAVGRVPDGRRIRADLLTARPAEGPLVELPTSTAAVAGPSAVGGPPAVADADRPGALAAANAFLHWWDDLLAEPELDAPSAWQPRRLEHAFAVQAELPSGPVVLRADDYRGGRLDWYSFSAADGPSLGAPAAPRPADRTVRTVLPTPAAFGGMPASRFWEIEDSTVRFGALAPGRTDVARMLLAEFALAYGNDWFVIPVDLPVGSVCRVDRFDVTDTFGELTTIGRSAGDDGAPPWRLFELATAEGSGPVPPLFFLAPVLAEIAESDPIEEVGLVRDELANLVWGVERRYQGGAGTAVDRYAEQQQRLAVAQRVETEVGDAQLLYRLATDVPYHWFPFVPVRPAGHHDIDAVIELERRPLVRVLADGTTEAPAPRGRILADPATAPSEQPSTGAVQPTPTGEATPTGEPTRTGEGMRIEEEEVPRSGTDVVRTFQLARWFDGRYLLWSGRHRRTGRGEGSSGLRFDAVGPAVR